jgi:hypothetical protein
VAIGQASHDGFPGQPELWPTAEEQEWCTVSRFDGVKECAIRLTIACFIW